MGSIEDYLVVLKVDILNRVGATWNYLLQIVWILNGVQRKLQDIKEGKEAVYTAQVLKNWYTLPTGLHINRNSFILAHDHFAPVKTVLRKNVFLLGIEENVAKFVELDADVDIFNIRKHPIFYMVQTMLTKKVILVPLKDLYDLVDSIDIDDKNVVWLFHTLRCGSTTWSQTFASLPGWNVISESQTMIYTLIQSRNILDLSVFAKTKEFEQIVVATIKMHIVAAPKGQSIFWKSIGVDELMIPIIKKHFPSHKLLFGYRDCLPSSISFYRSFGRDPTLINNVSHTCKELISGPVQRLHHNALGRAAWLYFTTGHNLELCLKAFEDAKPHPNGFEFYVILWSTKICLIRQFQKEGIDFKFLKYEDMQKDKETMIRDLFEHLGVSLDLVAVARKSMEVDSQAGTFFSRENKDMNRSWKRTVKSDERCNILLKAFDLPELDSKMVL